MLDHNIERELIEQAIKKFPEEFGLRNYPGHKFRICPSSSYFSDHHCAVLLYTRKLCEDGEWKKFAKSTVPELCENVVKLK